MKWYLISYSLPFSTRRTALLVHHCCQFLPRIRPWELHLPSVTTSQNQSFPRFETILSSSPSILPSSFTSVPSFVQTALHHCFVLIASAASCPRSTPCPRLTSSHPSPTNFASMAPPSSIASDETIPQRARSKSDAEIDYSSSKSKFPPFAFIYTMLVMLCGVIRRFRTSRVSLPAHWASLSTTRFPSFLPYPCSCYDASSSRSLRLFWRRELHLPL